MFHLLDAKRNVYIVCMANIGKYGVCMVNMGQVWCMYACVVDMGYIWCMCGKHWQIWCMYACVVDMGHVCMYGEHGANTVYVW